MTQSVPVGEVRFLGDRALLIGAADPAAGRALACALEGPFRGIDAEVVCGFASVAVVLNDPDGELDAVRAAVRDALAVASDRDAAVPDGRLVTIPCVFDGPDVAEVAALAGCRDDEIVALFTKQPLSVAVVGFSPGFAYLDGLPAALRSVPGDAPASRGAGGRRRAGQRPRRGVPHRFARGVAPGRPHRLSPLLGHGPALRRARPRRPRALHGGGRAAIRSSPPHLARRTGPRRRAPARCGRSSRRGCAPWCRTVVVAPWRRRGSRQPARPIRSPLPWPTGWRATRSGPAPSKSPAAAPACAASVLVTWRPSARRRSSASTAPTPWRAGWCR